MAHGDRKVRGAEFRLHDLRYTTASYLAPGGATPIDVAACCYCYAEPCPDGITPYPEVRLFLVRSVAYLPLVSS